jgi:hypothetical protein
MKILKTYEAFLGGQPGQAQSQGQSQSQGQPQSQGQSQSQGQAPQSPVNKRLQPQTILPNPTQTDLKSIYFYVPVKVSTNFDDNVFGYYTSIEDIVSKLSDDGIYADWLIDQFSTWKRWKSEDPGEEPMRDEYDEGEGGDADYEDDMTDWNERNDEYQRIEDADDSDLIYDYANDEFGSWDKFLEEFQTDVLITDSNLDRWDKRRIYSELKSDFNGENLIDYFDDAEELGVAEMSVIDNDFDDDGRFIIEVLTFKDLSDEEIEKISKYIEGQCSDGWGESFEQQPIVNGYYVSTWWSDDDKYGEYKIEIEK